MKAEERKEHDNNMKEYEKNKEERKQYRKELSSKIKKDLLRPFEIKRIIYKAINEPAASSDLTGAQDEGAVSDQVSQKINQCAQTFNSDDSISNLVKLADALRHIKAS